MTVVAALRSLTPPVAVLIYEFGTPLFQERHVGLAAISIRLTRRRNQLPACP